MIDEKKDGSMVSDASVSDFRFAGVGSRYKGTAEG